MSEGLFFENHIRILFHLLSNFQKLMRLIRIIHYYKFLLATYISLKLNLKTKDFLLDSSIILMVLDWQLVKSIFNISL